MIPILRLDNPEDRRRAETLFRKLRLDPRDLVLSASKDDAGVREILVDVAHRGDEALVESARRFDDPEFEASEIRVTAQEMETAASKLADRLRGALRKAITRVRDYQQAVMPGE